MEKTYRLGLVGLALAGTAMFGGMTRETRAADAEINNAIDRIGGAAAEALSNIERSQGNPEKAAGYRALSNIFGDSARINYDSSQREKDRQTLLEAARIQAGGGEQNAELQRQIQENNRLQRQLLDGRGPVLENSRETRKSEKERHLETHDKLRKITGGTTTPCQNDYERQIREDVDFQKNVVFTCAKYNSDENGATDMSSFKNFTRIFDVCQEINAVSVQYNFSSSTLKLDYYLIMLQPDEKNQLTKRKLVESGSLISIPPLNRAITVKSWIAPPGAYIFITEIINHKALETLFFVTEKEPAQANVEQKSETPKIAVLKDLASAEDKISMIEQQKEGEITVYANNRALGRYKIDKRFEFNEKISTDDIFVKTEAETGIPINIFKNKEYGYYMIRQQE